MNIHKITATALNVRLNDQRNEILVALKHLPHCIYDRIVHIPTENNADRMLSQEYSGDTWYDNH
jgi:hypothetical protein